MDLITYQPLALRTARRFDNKCLDLQHAALGLTTEYAELLQAIVKGEFEGVTEEVADFFWYGALFCDVMQMTLQEVWDQAPRDRSSTLVDSVVVLGNVVNFVKRVAIYDKVPTTQMMAALKADLGYLLREVGGGVRPEQLSEALDANINKLKLRYPDKFSTEAAEARADKGGLGPEVS